MKCLSPNVVIDELPKAVFSVFTSQAPGTLRDLTAEKINLNSIDSKLVGTLLPFQKEGVRYNTYCIVKPEILETIWVFWKNPVHFIFSWKVLEAPEVLSKCEIFLIRFLFLNVWEVLLIMKVFFIWSKVLKFSQFYKTQLQSTIIDDFICIAICTLGYTFAFCFCPFPIFAIFKIVLVKNFWKKPWETPGILYSNYYYYY